MANTTQHDDKSKSDQARKPTKRPESASDSKTGKSPEHADDNDRGRADGGDHGRSDGKRGQAR